MRRGIISFPSGETRRRLVLPSRSLLLFRLISPCGEESLAGDGRIAWGTGEEQISPSFLPFLLLHLLLSPSIDHRQSKSIADDRNRLPMADFGSTAR
ncbi:hypothetical protein B296_00055764 [Ensete ventricosum]|uniref:Uncharacterized protein n=1 Tax=Ensete ventricosum TaxID=4639 RepID=A0A426XY70_ENSVE|nr:hypothetical protein B296_00055764 [Ensete ventricosum]